MMAFNNSNNRHGLNASLDHVLAQSLMNRLQLRPPYLHTNSFLSNPLDDLLPIALNDIPDDCTDLGLDADDEPAHVEGDARSRQRRLLAREEARLEREIIRIVHSGGACEALRPNSGQSVSIGDHNVCIGVHEEPRSDYRVWEWHGHVMLFDEENGYDAEYIYGNYFERISDGKRDGDDDGAESEKEEVEEGEKKKVVANSGLRELIDGSKDSVGNGGGRVLHRNSLNTGAKPAE